MRIAGPRCECGGIVDYTVKIGTERKIKPRCRACYEAAIRDATRIYNSKPRAVDIDGISEVDIDWMIGALLK